MITLSFNQYISITQETKRTNEKSSSIQIKGNINKKRWNNEIEESEENKNIGEFVLILDISEIMFS